jgi:hypothetical protein
LTGWHQAQHEPGCGGFTATGFTHQTQSLTSGEVEGNSIHGTQGRLSMAEAIWHTNRIVFGKILNLKQRSHGEFRKQAA